MDSGPRGRKAVRYFRFPAVGRRMTADICTVIGVVALLALMIV